MKRETRFFTLLALGSTMAFSGIAQAQAPSAPVDQAATGAPAPGTVTNQTTTSESTTVVPAANDMMTETTTIQETAPLENTGGEPLLFAIGGALLAGSALVMRRRLSNEVR